MYISRYSKVIQRVLKSSSMHLISSGFTTSMRLGFPNGCGDIWHRHLLCSGQWLISPCFTCEALQHAYVTNATGVAHRYQRIALTGNNVLFHCAYYWPQCEFCYFTCFFLTTFSGHENELYILHTTVWGLAPLIEIGWVLYCYFPCLNSFIGHSFTSPT